MKNNRYPGDRIPVRAAAARTSGVMCVEAGFVGIPYTDAITGQVYALDIETGGVDDMPLVSGAQVSQTVHIAIASGALSVTAQGVAGAAGTVPVGRVVAVPDDPGGQPSPKSGRMNVFRFPQRP